MKTTVAIVAAALLLALVLLLHDRYTIVPTGNAGAVWRLDRLTGSMLLCGASGQEKALVCVQPKR